MLLAAELGFAVRLTDFTVAIALLLAFFVAFNILEASLPSLVSSVAPAALPAGGSPGIWGRLRCLYSESR